MTGRDNRHINYDIPCYDPGITLCYRSRWPATIFFFLNTTNEERNIFFIPAAYKSKTSVELWGPYLRTLAYTSDQKPFGTNILAVSFSH